MHTYTRFDLLNDRNLAQFYAACRTRNIAIVEFALQNKFPINSTVKSTSTDFLGDTALHLAVKAADTTCAPCTDIKDFDRIIEQLFSYGADATRTNAASYSAIHIVFLKRKYYLLDALFAGHGYNRPNITDQHGLSHFHIACFSNQKNLVENFLKHGVAINSKCGQYLEYSSDCGLTGLHFAAKESSIDTVKLLLKYKADVNVKNNRGFSPLRSLSEWEATFKSNTASALLLTDEYQDDCYGDIELFKLFHACQSEDFNKLRRALELKREIIRASVSNDSPHWPGYTLLHFASTFQIVDFMKELLFYCTRDDVNRTNAKKLTPLHCLLMESYSEKKEKGNQAGTILWIAKCLVQHGANVNFEGGDGLTPIDYALIRAREFKTEKFVQKFVEILGLSKFSDQEELNQLFYACLETDYDYVEKLAEDGRLENLINTATSSAVPHSLQGFTPLHFAVEGGDDKMVSMLLKNGADFCAQNVNGLSPLHLAERAQKSSIVGLILQVHLTKVANPVDKGGLSHLHIACKNSAYQVVQILIVSQINTRSIITTNIQNERNYDVIYTEGDSALHVIAKHGACNKITAGLFLHYGADFTLKNADATTPLHLFFTGCWFDVLDYILSTCRRKLENLINNDGWSYFHIACWMGKPNIVKEFLQKEKNLANEDNNPNKQTPLHAAIMYSKCLQVVQILVDYDAKVNALNNEGMTPLHYALMIPKDHEHKSEIINVLLSKIDIKETKPVDETGLTLLHIAAIQNDTKTMERLIKLGLDVNSAINLNSPLWPGFTALHLAVGFQCTDAIKILLDEGADWTVKTKNGIFPFGFTVREVARQAEICNTEDGHQAVFTAIHQSKKFSKLINIPSANRRSIFHLLCSARDSKTIQTMLELGGYVHCPIDFFSDENPGYTALHFAVNSGCLETIKVLINHGADVNAEDSFGWTPLHLACAQSSLEILKLLIRKRAYVNGHIIKPPLNFGHKPKFDYSAEYELATPLHICALLKKLDFFQFLLKNGADVCLTNAAGKNAVSMPQSRILSMEPIMHLQTLVFFDFSIDDQFDIYNDYRFHSALMPKDLEDECQKLLNDNTFIDKNTTLLDLITVTPRKMYQLMKQTKLQEILYSDELDKKYPNCGFILKLQFQKGLEYKTLIQNTIRMISPFVKYYLPLPELCIEKILENLDGDDLNNLVEISNSIFLNCTWFQ